VAAAFLKFSAALTSHSEEMILALLSLSASACFQIVLFNSSGRAMSLNSTDKTSTHRLSDFSSTICLILLLASSLFSNN
jgi:hypothetical protein